MKRLFGLVFLLVAAGVVRAEGVIEPGGKWVDDRGELIQAHGGGILQMGDTYYWFGEDRSKDIAKDHRGVACYSSTDLVHWVFRKRVVDSGRPEGVGEHWVLERPKVFHNEKTGKFVMYMHIDGPPAGSSEEGYILARGGVAVSDTVDGEYKMVGTFRPLGEESRDIGGFVDDDGAAYLIFESRPTGGFFIAKLLEDYLSVEKKVCFIKKPLEGGALVHYEGLYYVIGSKLSGWAPNANVYATAERLEGPWSEFKDLAPREAKTYGSQSTFLLKVVGKEKTTVVFMGDLWKPKELWDSRYFWMPVEIGGGRMGVPAPRAWGIEVGSGVVK
ncbi:MAG TPA: family 43 glycosylhydrolase [Tepidisphaeraceae bacterium]|nr:family 43 glycosylhydrolase [Tepidisphaeraceae bacterium]